MCYDFKDGCMCCWGCDVVVDVLMEGVIEVLILCDGNWFWVMVFNGL